MKHNVESLLYIHHVMFLNGIKVETEWFSSMYKNSFFNNI